MRHSLPRLIVGIVRQWCSVKQAEYLLGDVQEMYEQRLQARQRGARLFIWTDFISLLFHGVLKPSFKLKIFNFMILQNYLKVAVRSLLKQRVHSGINIIGLSIGLSVSLLIALYVLHELSYDRFHKNADRIYLLPMTWHFGGTDLPTANNCTAGGPLMGESFPQVEKYVRLTGTSRSLYKGREIIKEDKGLMADSTFFEIFSFPLLIGNPATALVEPNSIVLTRTMAEKYMGTYWADSIGTKTLENTNGKLLKVTGIMSDVPANSHLQFDYLISFSTLSNAKSPNWDNSVYRTYLLLNHNTDASELVSSIPKFIDEKYGAGSSDVIEMDLVPLKELYLYNQKYSMPFTSDILYIKIFSTIAILVLVIAVVNYINLATSRSIERSLEVGVRKVMGAFRKQLFSQFMVESFIITAVAIFLALVTTLVSLPLFNHLTGKTLELKTLLTPATIVLLVACAVGISILAGIYPAVIISRYQPSKVLKGKLKDSTAGIRLRKSLVVLQFGISIVLIISTLTVSKQLSFIRSKELGIDREKLVAVSLDSVAKTRIKPLKDVLGRENSVKGTSASTQIPVRIQFETKINKKNGSEEDWKLITMWGTDQDFAKTTGVELVNGTGFQDDTPPNEWQVIINQAALKFFGWNEDEAIGKEVTFWQSNGTVKGVVKDFHFSSLHNEIKPLVIFTGSDIGFFNFLLVNSTASALETRDVLEKHWKEINPDSPFVIHFLDETFDRMYEKENRLSGIVNVFSILAILISGLGLFGLASYSIVQRTKELGIRKVLGASIANLMIMVSKDFVTLIIIALVIATPISFYFMREWLATFAYKVEFNWLLVAGAGLIAILIVGLTVSYHSLHVARNNPVNSLRSE